MIAQDMGQSGFQHTNYTTVSCNSVIISLAPSLSTFFSATLPSLFLFNISLFFSLHILLVYPSSFFFTLRVQFLHVFCFFFRFWYMSMMLMIIVLSSSTTLLTSSIPYLRESCAIQPLLPYKLLMLTLAILTCLISSVILVR